MNELPAIAADLIAPVALDVLTVVASDASTAAEAGSFLSQLDAAFAQETPGGGEDEPGEAPFAVVVAPPLVLPEPLKPFVSVDTPYGAWRVSTQSPQSIDTPVESSAAPGSEPGLSEPGDRGATVPVQSPEASIDLTSVAVTAGQPATQLPRPLDTTPSNERLEAPPDLSTARTSMAIAAAESRVAAPAPVKPRQQDTATAVIPSPTEASAPATLVEPAATERITELPVDAVEEALVHAAVRPDAKDTQSTSTRSTSEAPADDPATVAVVATGAGRSESHQANTTNEDSTPEPAPRDHRLRAPSANFSVDGSSPTVTATPVLRSSVPVPNVPAMLTPETGDGVMEQVVQAVRWQWNGTSGSMQVRLQPDYLGAVSIDVLVDRGQVRASVSADTPAVRQWVESHAQELQTALAGESLVLAEFVVRDEESPRERPRRGDEPQPRLPRRFKDGTPPPIFEVLA